MQFIPSFSTLLAKCNSHSSSNISKISNSTPIQLAITLQHSQEEIQLLWLSWVVSYLTFQRIFWNRWNCTSSASWRQLASSIWSTGMVDKPECISATKVKVAEKQKSIEASKIATGLTKWARISTQSSVSLPVHEEWTKNGSNRKNKDRGRNGTKWTRISKYTKRITEYSEC